MDMCLDFETSLFRDIVNVNILLSTPHRAVMKEWVMIPPYMSVKVR